MEYHFQNSCTVPVHRSPIPIFLLFLTITIVILLLIQTMCIEWIRNITLQIILHRSRSDKANIFSEQSDSYQNVSNLDPKFLCEGRDLPFHIVQQLSREMAAANRNYLRRKEEISARTCDLNDEFVLNI